MAGKMFGIDGNSEALDPVREANARTLRDTRRGEKRAEDSLWRQRERARQEAIKADPAPPGAAPALDAFDYEADYPTLDPEMTEAGLMQSTALTPSKQRRLPGPNLDSPEMLTLHARCVDSYRRELDRQSDNRQEQAIDEDFYDGIQWDETDAATVEERGQIPLVFNIIATPVNWVIGTEKRGRSDFKVLPRRKEDSKPAEKKSDLLKYLSDVNGTPFARSEAFEDAVKVGVGWVENGWQGDDVEGEPLYCRYVSWRAMLWDSASTDKDLESGRYMHRMGWFDYDVAVAMFPRRRGLLSRCIESPMPYMSQDSLSDVAMDQIEAANLDHIDTTGNMHSARARVRMIETWFRIPKNVDVMRGGMFAGEIFDPASIGHVSELNSGTATLAKKMRMQMHVAIWVSGGLLWASPSPYRHNRFPFTPIWGNRRGRDKLPYGMIRGLRDIQADVNKRASKALHIMNSNKVIMDEGAVDDIEEFREEVSRPDAVIVKAFGKELKIDVDRDMTQWQMEMMKNHIAMAERQAGVNDDNLGRQTNAHSGIAIERRQDQGAMVTTIYFDNLRFAVSKMGEKELANVEQFMSQKKQFRITNMRGTPDFIDINDGLPENDIVRSKADFVISEADWRATMREAAANELLDVISKFDPQVSLQLLDLLVDEMDIRNRDEIVKRIRSITGQKDPDADPNQPTEEEMQREQAAAQQQQQQEAVLQAELRKTLSEAAKNEATARQIVAKMVGDNVAAQNAALAAATQALSIPAAVPVADFMLDQAGYESKSDQESQGRQMSALAAEAQQAPAAQQQPGQPQPGAQPLGLGMAPSPQPMAA